MLVLLPRRTREMIKTLKRSVTINSRHCQSADKNTTTA